MKKSIYHVTSYTDSIQNTSEYLILQHAFFCEFGLVLSRTEMGRSDWSIGLDNRHCSIAAGHCGLTKYFFRMIECRTAYWLSIV